MKPTMLSEAEEIALSKCKEGILITSIPDRTYMDGYEMIPGMGVYRKLIKKGLAFQTEEDKENEDWTPMICAIGEDEDE